MVMNASLDTANINAINISTLDFRIWEHFSNSLTKFHLQKLTTVPEVSVTQLYRDMINTSEPIHSFTIKDDDGDSSLIWTTLKHPGTYIGTIGMISAVCKGVHCFKRFWIRPATPGYQPYSPVSSWHTTVDDDVEVAPIYKCRGKVEKPRRPCRNHDLHIEWEAERLQTCCGKGSSYIWIIGP